MNYNARTLELEGSYGSVGGAYPRRQYFSTDMTWHIVNLGDWTGPIHAKLRTSGLCRGDDMYTRQQVYGRQLVAPYRRVCIFIISSMTRVDEPTPRNRLITSERPLASELFHLRTSVAIRLLVMEKETVELSCARDPLGIAPTKRKTSETDRDIQNDAGEYPVHIRPPHTSWQTQRGAPSTYNWKNRRLSVRKLCDRAPPRYQCYHAVDMKDGPPSRAPCDSEFSRSAFI